MYSKLTDEEVDDLRAYVPRPVLYKVLNKCWAIAFMLTHSIMYILRRRLVRN